MMIIGALITLNSYELGKRAGTKEIVTDSGNGMKNYRWDIDEDKIDASTEAYKTVGGMVLLIGGIGMVSVLVKNK